MQSAKKKNKKILLINPWIYDFAAYDLWSRPLSLLKFATIFRNQGMQVSLIDCLNRFDPELPSYLQQTPRKDRFGCGKFHKKKQQKPEIIQAIERPYYRYGIPQALFSEKLASCEKPDIILLASGMTFWYPGIQKVVSLVKARWKKTPIILGGIYASLCPAHARQTSGADFVFSGGNIHDFLTFLAEKTGVVCHPPEEYPLPAVDLLDQQKSLVVQTSLGCPFSCTYCASHKLFPTLFQRKTTHVINEISSYTEKYNTEDIAFYDDALLFNKENHLLPILKELRRRNSTIQFHTPNAIHARWLDKSTAATMKEGGFKTIRLGLESSHERIQKATGQKVSCQEFKQAAEALLHAGFSRKELGAYILVGLPNQNKQVIYDDVSFLTEECGIGVILATFSPIPGTVLWDQLIAASILSADEDPLWQNNSIFFTRTKTWNIDEMRKLRVWVKEKNRHIGASEIMS